MLLLAWRLRRGLHNDSLLRPLDGEGDVHTLRRRVGDGWGKDIAVKERHADPPKRLRRRGAVLLVLSGVAAVAFWNCRPIAAWWGYGPSSARDCRRVRLGMTEADVHAVMTYPASTARLQRSRRCLVWEQRWSGAAVTPEVCLSADTSLVVQATCDDGWELGPYVSSTERN